MKKLWISIFLAAGLAFVMLPFLSPQHSGPPKIEYASRSNGGWDLAVSFDRPIDSAEARPAGHSIWTSGQCSGNQLNASFADLPRQAQIEVRAKTKDGVVLGPYTLPFDAIASLRSEAIEALRMTPRGWCEITHHDVGGPYWVMFTQLVCWRWGVQEVRYSIDSDALDKRFQLPPPSFDDPCSIPGNCEAYLTLTKAPKFVAVQLVYADGSVSDVVRVPGEKG